MKKQDERKKHYRFVCGVLLCLIAIGTFFAVWYSFVKVNNFTGNLLGRGNLGMAIMIYSFLYGFTAYMLQGFKIGVKRKVDTIASNITALFITDVIEILISMAITGQFRFVGQFALRYALLFVVQSAVIGLLMIPMTNIYRKVFPPLRVLEVHGDYSNDVCRKVNLIHFKYRVEERADYRDDDLEQRILKYEAVLINDVPAEDRNSILKFCYEHEIRVYFVPKVSDIIIKASDGLNLIDTPLYLCRNTDIPWAQRTIKRAFDVVLSGMAILILSPVFLVTAIAIKANDGGPVFFRQERVTIGGKRFKIIKFRSMIVDAEKDGKSHPAGENDDRITSVGHVIRATRIDELPQLFNILKGDMSIVGPRPERVEHVEKYTADIPEFAFRHRVKGGLTGYAQVYGKYNTAALDKLKMDLEYIMNYSLRVDIQIILETIKVIFQKESTEGFTAKSAAELHDYVSVDR